MRQGAAPAARGVLGVAAPQVSVGPELTSGKREPLDQGPRFPHGVPHRLPLRTSLPRGVTRPTPGPNGQRIPQNPKHTH